MSGGPNPAIWADAAGKALGESQTHAADAHDLSAEQAILDEAELHDLEHAEYYPAPAPPPAVPPSPAPRSLLDRLLGRSPR